MPRPAGKKSIPESTFIRAWNTSATAKEAAFVLRLAPISARCRAVKLRKRGVPMKWFSTRRQKVEAR